MEAVEAMTCGMQRAIGLDRLQVIDQTERSESASFALCPLRPDNQRRFPLPFLGQHKPAATISPRRTRRQSSSSSSDMSKDKLEGLVKRMEATLSEMEQLKLHCSRQSEELSQLVVELRRENQELAQKYEQLAMDMKEAKEIIEQLQDTKFAFDAKERQAQKLSRQL